MRRALVLDIGGVFYLDRPDDAFWTRWGARTGTNGAHLKAGVWHGPDIEATNAGRLHRDAYFARTAARLGISPAHAEAMIREAFAGGMNTALAEHVRGLRARGAAVHALTNNWSLERELKARPEFDGLFDLVVSSCEVGCAKPGADIYRLALERFGRTADEIVFVDDTPACVETARMLGIRTVHFQTTDQAIREIETLLLAD
jgi:putative hydrolase of the HAD superfamily